MNTCAIKRRQALINLGLLGISGLPRLATASEPADSWPSGPSRIIVPYAAGASTDVVSRRLAMSLTQKLGQSFFVENKPGANGVIGIGTVVREKADGGTFVISDTTITMVPSMRKDMPYDVTQDLVPIAAFFFSPFGVVVNADSPYKTLQDLIDAARKAPGTLGFGSGGEGSSPHLATEDFSGKAGVQLLHVPYKGAGDAINALMGNQISLQFATPSTAIGNVKGGRLRMLAISGERRLDLLPDVPTFKEAGLPSFQFSNWQGLFARRGTSDTIVQKLSAQVEKIMQDDEMSKFAAGLGANTNCITGEPLRRMIASELVRWKSVTERMGFAKK
ncbi:tripartite tricarboxylate transporter substrate binding protein [Hydrogenophaga sp.]|uniref:Bug family tripartite tricarboxylate transporter substrate binding protein n=1 Tax=Hydrogenophaga sp. TaxID=1904254 RepID=UPI0027213640|nr:tripartite tricarboxylate transporter substrate binding protein [Hydrogenophaga sp.]MDO9435379.1 tripartite tricarboxylate transporter substrate binding protein [Hydrogenophaga sp.]